MGIDRDLCDVLFADLCFPRGQGAGKEKGKNPSNSRSKISNVEREDVISSIVGVEGTNTGC